MGWSLWGVRYEDCSEAHAHSICSAAWGEQGSGVSEHAAHGALEESVGHRLAGVLPPTGETQTGAA